MITLCILLLMALAIAIIALLVTGIAVVFWPVLIVLGVGLFLDILVIKSIFKKRGD